MRQFSSVQHQKRKPSITSPYSLEQPARQFASLLSPALQSPPPAVDAQLEHAHLFGHTLDQISIFPPAVVSTPSVTPVSPEQDIVPPENHTGLPDALKAGVESLSGFSLDDVRVHYNSSKPAEVRALAYTQGSEIHVGPGQEQYLVHEAWHVVQQMQGRVRPTLQVKGVAINDDRGLEKEADIMGAQAEHVGNVGACIEQVTAREQNLAGDSPMQLQQALENVSGYMDSGGTWDTWVDGKNRVVKMEAKNLKLARGNKSKKVAPAGTNNPKASASPEGWAKIVAKKLTTTPPRYVRMHLLNGRLGGPGEDANLTPGSASLNSQHSSQCEQPLKDYIEAGSTMNYTVTVVYNSSRGTKISSADKTDWESCAFEITGKLYEVLPGKSPALRGTFVAEEDPNLDGYW